MTDMGRNLIHLIATLFLFVLTSYYSSAQNEWEDVAISSFKWGTNPNLIVTSNSLSNLTLWNPHAESKINKRGNRWTSHNISMNLSWTESRPWRILFSIWNGNNQPNSKYRVYDENNKETWHTGDIFWGFKITVKTTNGEETYTNFYSDTKSYTSNYTHKRAFNSDRNTWIDAYDFTQRRITIYFDGNNTISISGDGHTFHTFYGAKSLSSITICAGPAAEVHVTNFTLQSQTAYAEVKPFITSGDSKYKNNDYWGAIEDYTKAIERGHKAYDVYYKRASSYYALEFYSNAIDDYTSAISFKETEEAYLNRGLSKLQNNDSSCLDDFKRGGTRGVAIAREIEGQNGFEKGPSSKYIASGTGFFIDTKGIIATNYHVVEEASGIDIFVMSNGQTKQYSAEVIVSDRTNDLALLKINDSKYKEVTSIPYTLGKGVRDVGTKVFAMGYPELSSLGEEIKVTDGIISSKTGYQGDITTYQISAPIQHGNSGGPLFDNSGTVIGITNAGISSLQNVGYAIKVSYLLNLIESCCERVSLPSTNQVSLYSFTEQVKRVSPFVVIIKTYNKNSLGPKSSTKSASSTSSSTSSKKSSSSSTSSGTIGILINETVELSTRNKTIVSFESNDPSIASVNSKGLVTGKKEGKTTIWATFADGKLEPIFITVRSRK